MKPGKKDLTIRRGATYRGFIFVCQDAAGEAVDLTGWTAEAVVRKKPGAAVVLDLEPEITDAEAGEVTIPERTPEETLALTSTEYSWDLVLIDTEDRRRGPLLCGRVNVTNIITTPTA